MKGISRVVIIGLISIVALVSVLYLSEPAKAVTFCVPSFESGYNVTIWNTSTNSDYPDYWDAGIMVCQANMTNDEVHISDCFDGLIKNNTAYRIQVVYMVDGAYSCGFQGQNEDSFFELKGFKKWAGSSAIIHSCDYADGFGEDTGNPECDIHLVGDDIRMNNSAAAGNDVITSPSNVDAFLFNFTTGLVSSSNESYFNYTTEWPYRGYEESSKLGIYTPSTCTYSGSGNWYFDCSDNCLVSSITDLGGNDIITYGEGSVYLDALVYGIGRVEIGNSCRIVSYGKNLII